MLIIPDFSKCLKQKLFIFNLYKMFLQTQSLLQKILLTSISLGLFLFITKKISSQYKIFNSKSSMMKPSQGLPNIGNTCFLNTVLQGLFSVTKFREQILSQRQKSQSMSSYLKEIFLAIKQQVNDEKKRTILKIFQKNLVKQVEHYAGFTQQDASYFLSQILDQLRKQNYNYQNYFKFSSLSKCQNNCEESNYIVQNQMYFPVQQYICPNPKCFNSKILKILKQIPEAILINNLKQIKQEIQICCIPNWNSLNQQLKQKILFSRIDNKNQYFKFYSKIKYSLKSIILYRGNKQFGHYVNLRASQKSQNKFKLIDDLHVSQQKSLKEYGFSNFQPLLFIYEKNNTDIIDSQQSEVDKESTINSRYEPQNKKKSHQKKENSRRYFLDCCQVI